MKVYVVGYKERALVAFSDKERAKTYVYNCMLDITEASDDYWIDEIEVK